MKLRLVGLVELWLDRLERVPPLEHKVIEG